MVEVKKDIAKMSLVARDIAHLTENLRPPRGLTHASDDASAIASFARPGSTMVNAAGFGCSVV